MSDEARKTDFTACYPCEGRGWMTTEHGDRQECDWCDGYGGSVFISEEPDHEPRVALHNDPSSPTCVSEMTDAEVAFCHRNAVLMDDEIREQINGRTDDDREWLALYAAAHEAVHGAPWCLP